MHQVSSSSGGASRPSFVNAYWIDRVMPIFGSVSVPSRSKKMMFMRAKLPLAPSPCTNEPGRQWAGGEKRAYLKPGEVGLSHRRWVTSHEGRGRFAQQIG